MVIKNRSIRPFVKADIPQVADLCEKVFGGRESRSTNTESLFRGGFSIVLGMMMFCPHWFIRITIKRSRIDEWNAERIQHFDTA